ncbi:MAG: TrkA family potassium uptake protein [Dehalococcoidales bacterium]|nr:TrkA family potassium uptake protein [Dehalococcoidales bacterium]
MKKQVAVIGLGRFGISLATTLASEGHDVLAIDKDETKVQNIASQLTHAVQADSVNENILRELGIDNFDIAVVAIGSAIESSVLTTILCKKLGVKYIIARANDELHGSILEKIGADSVVYAEQQMGSRIAHGITLTDVWDYMNVTPSYGIIQYRVPLYLDGETITSLELGQSGKWEVAALLIQRENEVIVTPDRTQTVKAGDILIMSGNDDKLEKILEYFRAKRPETR